MIIRENDLANLEREATMIHGERQYATQVEVLWRWGAYTLAEDRLDFVGKVYEQAALDEDDNVVDIGSMDGANMVRLRDEYGHRGEITCVDVNSEVEKKQPEHGKPFNYFFEDGQQTHFEDNSFDALFASFCLYHFDDPAAGLQEFQRIVRPGGKIIIATSGRFNKILHRIFEHKQAEDMTRRQQEAGLDEEVLPPPIFNRTFTRQIAQRILPHYFEVSEESQVVQQVPLLVTCENEEEIYKDSLLSMKSEFVRRSNNNDLAEDTIVKYGSMWLPSYMTVVHPVIQNAIAETGYFADYIDRWAAVCYNTKKEG